MKTLLVDDEAPARMEMRKLLSLHPEVHVVGEAADVETALQLTESESPDLVFLDIQLAGESGFDYVARVPDSGPRIVFVTAYDRYAVRAFECNALDYLLKPVHPDRLAETLRRSRASSPDRPAAAENDAILIKSGPTARLVPWKLIQCIISDGNYTRVVLADGAELSVLRPLKEWLPLTPTDHFLQVHRGALVRREAVREIHRLGEKKLEIRLAGNIRVAVGRDYAAAVRSLF